MRRYSRPTAPTRSHRYHVVRTTLAEELAQQAEDRERALNHLLRIQEEGPLTPAQQTLLKLLQTTSR